MLITMFLILSISACSTKTITKYVVKRPPQEYTDPCPIPLLEGNTVQDLQLYTIDLKGELSKCNLKNELELEWFDRVELELNGK